MWIRDYALNPLNSCMISDQVLNLAIGPSRYARTWHMYYVNGSNFHTMFHSSGRNTTNTDVCVTGEEGDYYGRLIDVIELDYKGSSQLNSIVLFKCEWFDPVKNRGWKIHNEFGIVDINHNKKLSKYDPFILAQQAQQVYFLPYHSLRRNRVDWWAVCRTKARSTIVAPSQSVAAYQEDIAVPFIVTEHDVVEALADNACNLEEMESEEVDEAGMQEAGEQMDSEDRRVTLTVQGKAFFPSHNVTSCITSIWKAQFTGQWDTWKSIPQTEKDNWFSDFKAAY